MSDPAPLRTYWMLSFATEERFLGGFVTEAPNFEHAFIKATMAKANPGGEVQGYAFRAESVAPEYLDRLLTKDEVSGMPPPVGLTGVAET